MDRTGRIGAPLAPAPPLVLRLPMNELCAREANPTTAVLSIVALPPTGCTSRIVHWQQVTAGSFARPGSEHENVGWFGVCLRLGTLDTISAPNAISSSVKNRQCLV